MQMKADIENKKAQLVQHRKSQILAAAKQIFAQNGFRRTKIEQIASYLNIGKGTIYRYFKDKKNLFLAVFQQGIAQFRQTIADRVEPITDPPRKIAMAVKNYFEFFDNDRELIEIIMQVRSEFKDDYRRTFMLVYSDYIVKIQENLRNGIKKGVFRKMNIEETAEAISATLQGVLQGFYIRELARHAVTQDSQETNIEYRASSIKKQSLTDRTEAVTELLLEGLLKRHSQ